MLIRATFLGERTCNLIFFSIMIEHGCFFTGNEITLPKHYGYPPLRQTRWSSLMKIMEERTLTFNLYFTNASLTYVVTLILV